MGRMVKEKRYKKVSKKVLSVELNELGHDEHNNSTTAFSQPSSPVSSPLNERRDLVGETDSKQSPEGLTPDNVASTSLQAAGPETNSINSSDEGSPRDDNGECRGDGEDGKDDRSNKSGADLTADEAEEETNVVPVIVDKIAAKPTKR